MVYYNDIHNYYRPLRPDLIDYDGLRPNNAISNLNNAFDTAQKQLGIASLLDAEGNS